MSEQLSTEQRIAAVKLYYETKNSAEVQRRWSKIFNSSPPARNSILDLVRKFEATGSVLYAKGDGRPRTATTAEKQEELAASLKRSPQKSSRRLSTELGVLQKVVLSMFEELNYHPFRPHRIHGLHEEDFDKGSNFPKPFLTWSKMMKLSSIAFTPDFFLRGVLKDRVYANKPRTITDLKREIELAIRGIPRDLCAKVCRSVPSRLQKCLELEGAQTELF